MDSVNGLKRAALEEEREFVDVIAKRKKANREKDLKQSMTRTVEIGREGKYALGKMEGPVGQTTSYGLRSCQLGLISHHDAFRNECERIIENRRDGIDFKCRSNVYAMGIRHLAIEMRFYVFGELFYIKPERHHYGFIKTIDSGITDDGRIASHAMNGVGDDMLNVLRSMPENRISPTLKASFYEFLLVLRHRSPYSASGDLYGLTPCLKAIYDFL